MSNVPTGGVSNDGWLYAFFWTQHCDGIKDHPCPWGVLTKYGVGGLARSNDDGVTFHDYVPTPPGFVYSTAVEATAIAELPAQQRLGTYVFGVPKYRERVPYLAYAPPGTLGNPAGWQFFVGREPDGQPKWVPWDTWQPGAARGQPPGNPELFWTDDPSDRCVGEFSVTWNRALGVWLLLYNCARGGLTASIEARIAEAPWGPWSTPPAVILDADRDSL
jgi:hypothetical protein